MSFLKKVAIFLLGCFILIGIGTIPDILSHLINNSEGPHYQITKPQRWMVNIEADNAIKHDTSYFYTTAIIQGDSIKEILLPSKQVVKSPKCTLPLDDHDEIDVQSSGVEYIVKLIKRK